MKFNYETTEIAINEHFKWKTETFPIDTAPFQHFLLQGIMYAHKRDKG